MRKLLLLMVGVLCITAQLLAQNRTISGKITDEHGKGLAAVTVTVRGTKLGTTTDSDGNFTLNVPGNATAIVVSSIGYTETTLSIAGKTEVSVQLKPSSGDMNEVVVVAYGVQKKESITGSIATIGAKQLENRLTTNITQALAGAAPGISATSGNGQPGSSAALRIRGFGSVNASSAPLFVVDGFPYEGFIGDLNTNDIETISLLKDASSTALYGARAANGVVLITT
ncbi:MAG TPA: TonB-dependent receptor plug domain-containing protein, partial [Chitinophagaceae bacterium]